MNVKKIKRKCGVKGCRNTETYTISKVRDFGDTVLICESCLKESLEAIKNYGKEPPKKEAAPPPNMFYSHLTTPSNGTLRTASPTPAGEFVCPKCGKEYKTKLNLSNHVKKCKADEGGLGSETSGGEEDKT